MVQCAIDLLENFVNCEAQSDDGYWSGDGTIPHNNHFQILLPIGLSMPFHKIHSSIHAKQIVFYPIPKFTQMSKISPFFSALFCFVILTFNINLNIFLDLKTFQNTFITTIYSSTFTKLSGVRISALYLILNGTKEEHLNMLEGGIIAKLLDEKWSTFAKVVSSTWHWNRDK